MLDRPRIIRPTFEDVFYIDRLKRSGWQQPRLELLVHPTVAASATSSSTTTTSHVMDLPSGNTAGSLDFMLWVPTATAETLTWPAGWTGIVNTTFNAGARRAQIAYRICDGSEGATITGTTSGSTSASASALRIAGHKAIAPHVGTSAVGTSTAPNPPSFDPGVGSKEFLWLAWTAALQVVNTAPTNYTLEGASGGRAFARRALTASSEDPGAFAIAGSQPWIAGIIAVEPAIVPLVKHHRRMMGGH